MSKLKETLKKLSQIYKEEVVKGIVAKDMVASGKLKNSIQTELQENGFSLSSDEIYGYLLGDDGFRPKRKGSKEDRIAKWDRLGEWARKKGMRPLLRKSNGRFRKLNHKSYRRLGFILSKSINEKGTIERFGYRGSQVISDTIQKLQATSEDVIVEAFKDDIVTIIKEDFKFDNIKIQ